MTYINTSSLCVIIIISPILTIIYSLFGFTVGDGLPDNPNSIPFLAPYITTYFITK